MRKLNVMIVAGLIVAIVGAAVVIIYGHSVDRRIANGKATSTVLVATASIPAGVSVDALSAFVKAKAIPKAYQVQSPLSSLSGVQGVLQVGVAKGSQLSSLVIGTQAPAIGTGAVTPRRGTVALAIQVGLTPGVAKYVSPGSTVDMFVTYSVVDTTGGNSSSGTNASTAANRLSQQTKLFATGVKVLSVTPATDQTASSTSTTSQAQVSPGDQVIAVLEVAPSLAQKIVNATILGQIYLALDARGDTHRTPRGATPADVVGSNR